MQPHDTTPQTLCECGCGQPAPIAKRSNSKLGHVKGQPVRFIVGHHNKIRPIRPLADRFWEKVDARGADDCWEWTACRDQHGYGQIQTGTYGKSQHVRAHRLSYELHNGPIPDGLDILHNCDNPSCVNPGHLYAGTPKNNADDMLARARTNNYEGEDHPGAMYTNAQVQAFREEFARRGGTITAFAAFHDAPYETMRKLLKRLTYQNV